MTHERADQLDALRALGARRRDNIGFALVRAAVVGAGGALGAAVVGVLLSGRFPVGVARGAEPDPGLRLDLPVLLVGAAAIVVITTAGAIPPAVRGVRTRSGRLRSTAPRTTLASTRLSPAAVQGVRFAAVGGGARAIPMRTTLVAVTVAVAAVVATVSFGASMNGLIDTPARYGQGWDRMVDSQFGTAPTSLVATSMRGIDGIRGIGVGNYGTVDVNGVPVAAFDLRVVGGDVAITTVEGAGARRPGEIVLGGEVLDRLSVRVGDVVEVDTGAGTSAMVVTGRGVFPHMGQGSFSTTGLGVGAQLAGDSLPSFGGIDVPPGYELDGRRYNFAVVDAADEPARLDSALAAVEAQAHADGSFTFVRSEQPPTKIRDLDRVRVVPAGMVVVLALVAVAALAHLLVSSVRERRRELALLRTLGFSGRELHASVAWQASVVTVAALAIGAPVGLALGTFVWNRFARSLHAFAPAETPWAWLSIALVATIVLANAVAAVPGRIAARTEPAVILRDE